MSKHRKTEETLWRESLVWQQHEARKRWHMLPGDLVRVDGRITSTLNTALISDYDTYDVVVGCVTFNVIAIVMQNDECFKQIRKRVGLSEYDARNVGAFAFIHVLHVSNTTSYNKKLLLDEPWRWLHCTDQQPIEDVVVVR